MSKAYLQIAEGYRLLAAGYEALAGEDGAMEKAPKKDAKKAARDEKTVQSDTQTDEEARVSIEDIRAVMRTRNKEGKMEKCQAVLREFGAVKLSDVPEDKYPELMKKVEVL